MTKQAVSEFNCAIAGETPGSWIVDISRGPKGLEVPKSWGTLKRRHVHKDYRHHRQKYPWVLRMQAQMARDLMEGARA